MKKSLRRKLTQRKRRTQKRIDKSNWSGQSPMLGCPSMKLELAEKTQAVSGGGIALVQQLVRQLGLAESINHNCRIFKMYMPYTEADHLLNIAFNIFAGGTCLEHLELRRNDEAYLNLLGTQRVPDPTTAGDFCRRFTPAAVDRLMDAINETRIKVWQQQPDSFFDMAIIEGDGTMVETCGEKKEGIGLNHKKQWGGFHTAVPPSIGDHTRQHARRTLPVEPFRQPTITPEGREVWLSKTQDLSEEVMIP